MEHLGNHTLQHMPPNHKACRFDLCCPHFLSAFTVKLSDKGGNAPKIILKKKKSLCISSPLYLSVDWEAAEVLLDSL